MKKLLRKLIPKWLLSLYHLILAVLANLVYLFPSRKLVVIGVTGTKGKTTTCNLIWAALSGSGEKVGMLTTANFRLGSEEKLNAKHMTMLGRLELQRSLARFVREGCKYAVVEVSSEGIKQWRHWGICFDVAVMTNMSPEHITAHGSYVKYRAAKSKLFKKVVGCHRKRVNGQAVPRVIILNKDDAEYQFFSRFSADHTVTYSVDNPADFQAQNITSDLTGLSLQVKGYDVHTNLLGKFNTYNVLAAVAVAYSLGVNWEYIATGLDKIIGVPGRMEQINCGQEFKVLVDYAHEKTSMTAILESAREWRTPSFAPCGATEGSLSSAFAEENLEHSKRERKILVLLGAEGGGRDKGKRTQMGEVAGKLADVVVVSNVDPYNDDPAEIVEDIAVAAETAGKIRHKDLWLIEDRRLGIRKILSLAQAGDLVFITGKGSEQSMSIGGKVIEWDDRMVVREELNQITRDK